MTGKYHISGIVSSFVAAAIMHVGVNYLLNPMVHESREKEASSFHNHDVTGGPDSDFFIVDRYGAELETTLVQIDGMPVDSVSPRDYRARNPQNP